MPQPGKQPIVEVLIETYNNSRGLLRDTRGRGNYGDSAYDSPTLQLDPSRRNAFMHKAVADMGVALGAQPTEEQIRDG